MFFFQNFPFYVFFDLKCFEMHSPVMLEMQDKKYMYETCVHSRTMSEINSKRRKNINAYPIFHVLVFVHKKGVNHLSC